MSSNAESQAQSARTAEDTGAICSDYATSEGSAGVRSSTERDIGFGVDRTDSTGADLISSSIAGKIVTQLIKEAEDQLDNARACIKWYEDEEQKALAKIAELRQLEQTVQAEAEESDSD